MRDIILEIKKQRAYSNESIFCSAGKSTEAFEYPIPDKQNGKLEIPLEV